MTFLHKSLLVVLCYPVIFAGYIFASGSKKSLDQGLLEKVVTRSYTSSAGQTEMDTQQRAVESNGYADGLWRKIYFGPGLLTWGPGIFQLQRTCRKGWRYKDEGKEDSRFGCISISGVGEGAGDTLNSKSRR